MSTQNSRPDKSDGTDLPECGQTIIDRIEEAIRGPDAKCGNGPAAVIAYAERQTTADFSEAADALKCMVDRGDVIRTERGLKLVETDGGAEVVLACPECDGRRLETRVDGVNGPERSGDGSHYCKDCGEAVDAVERPLAERGHPQRGPAYELAKADPDDIVTDGGVPEGDVDELDRRAQAAARALLKYAEATGQRPEWLLAFERHREGEPGTPLAADGGLVEACPECESSEINQRIGHQYDEDERYLCLDCRHTFAEPIQREPIQNKGGNYSDAGAALRTADDLDDLRADGTGTVELAGDDRLDCVRGSAHVEGVSEVFEDSFADRELSVGTGYSDAGAFLNLVYEDGNVEIDLGAVLTPEGARALATALEALAETAEER